MNSIVFTVVGVFPPPNTALVALVDCQPISNLGLGKSPKSDTFPVVEIVTNSIVFFTDGVPPPAIIPRVVEDAVKGYTQLPLKSPKSTAFPSDAIVT